MSQRKHISWKTKCAAALVHCNIIPREEAKLLEEDQLLSLFHWDHNEFYTLDSASRDRFWNLTPMLIRAHRQKTKLDAKIIAKGKRIRRGEELRNLGFIRAGMQELLLAHDLDPRIYLHPKRKLKSRGFDKTRRKKMDGTVVKR